MATEDPQIPPHEPDLEAARRRLEGHAHRTPVLTSATLDDLTGAQLFFKCENFQRIGAFKFRGAYNTLASLDPAVRQRGVVTHSSGNHAQAVALSARQFGVPAWVVMPSNAPRVKRQAVEGYGAEVRPCEPTMAAREGGCEAVIGATGATLVHPFDDPRIIAGQGTATLELLEEIEGLDAVLVPVGGGGLASGAVLACRQHSPTTKVFGGEPAGADDAARSLASGTLQPSIAPQTIADGLRGNLGPLTFKILEHGLEAIVTVAEETIVEAMKMLWERMKLVVEPSAAVPLAALLEGHRDGRLDLAGARVGIVLSGGNVDLGDLPW